MKKGIILIISALLVGVVVKAQNISLVNGKIIYTVDALTGEIKDANSQLMGIIVHQGIIYDEFNVQIAHFSNSNKLITESEIEVGSINGAGMVRN